ncbi:MAG: hypothetical protein M5U28_23210 [Sandaracinaceae bacterium]|nr:hypothetical protein [Sandaracinaceae bacterium]
MDEPAPFEPRDLVWFELGEKQRWAIVLEVDAANRRAIVIHGTSVERAFDCVRVEHRTRDGQALMLSCTTYFYPSNVTPAKFEELSPRGRRCPIALFVRLKALAGIA